MASQAQRARSAHGARAALEGRASMTASIAEAVVMKDDALFFLSASSGDVPMDESHGLGLYYRDCRFLDGYELRIGDQPPDSLASMSAAGSSATFELGNPEVRSPDGRTLQKEHVGIRWERTLSAEASALHDTIAFTNFSVGRAIVPVTIRLRSRFQSLFAVRGVAQAHRGTLHDPRWHGGTLTFAYDGADSIRRAVDASFDPPPTRVDDTAAIFDLAIESRQTATIAVTLRVSESSVGQNPSRKSLDVVATRGAAERAARDWMHQATRVESDDPALSRALDRSVLDLHLLRTRLNDREYFAAGVPWYVALFGRDSVISAIEALAFMPDRAEDTVRLLASYQGTHTDQWRDESPGKILHELRVGEMAHLNEIPQTPYYGSVDATPLFLVLIARHAAWTGRLDLFTSLRPQIERALQWIDQTMDSGEGYLVYSTSSRKGLANQGWKDSGDAISNSDGSLARPPIALVEVQGYVYLAKSGLADLYRRSGDEQTADRLLDDARRLRERFDRDFWSDDLGTYVLALQDGGVPASVVSSNPGHALWTGIATAPHAAQTAERLMRDDMFSGWGIRSLSMHECRYNPIGYHNGTVWPHDNALAAAGFRRAGRLDELTRVMHGIVDAAGQFDHDRLPEVFAGFSRQDFAIPVRYPVACHPQAWAAGALLFMIESGLGLEPDAFNQALRIARPALPDSVKTLTLDRLRVGSATVRIQFDRASDGRVRVQDVRVDGALEVTAED